MTIDPAILAKEMAEAQAREEEHAAWQEQLRQAHLNTLVNEHGELIAIVRELTQKTTLEVMAMVTARLRAKDALR